MDNRTKVQVRKNDGEKGSWTPPSIADDEFRQLIGSSVLEQFVAGHDPMDVVRELVQNEFDAGGAAMSLEFSDDALIVSGTGKFIDAKGWARLGVILGTGTVVGAGGSGSIAPKEEGIGSKNLGLRSLFRFGDRIHVYSNGKMAVLDLPCMGTLQKPDSASRAQAGIKIVVPFRKQARGILSGFDADAESRAIDEIAAGLFGTLGKLSLTGRKPGIRRLTVSSVRSGRRLAWNQTSKASHSPAKGVSVTVRSGRLVDQTEGTPYGKITNYEDMEFSRVVEIPGSQVAPSYPPYYKARGGRVLVAVSVPLRRKRIDFTQEGYFHYPLRAPGGMTGTVLSASAPFELDADRSELVATDWNTWLAGEAGALVSDLLVADWIDRFGPDAFLALRKVGGTTRSWFVDRIHFDLAANAIWPTETSGMFAKASELVVPPLPELRGFLGKERDLKGEFASRTDIADLARASGAKSFEANSLVRLRCAGNNRSALKTKMLPTDADFHYSDFNSALSQVHTQVSFAKALNAVNKRLSNNNRVDLKESVSTLAADGSLKPASMLTVVDANIWAVCPIPLSTRLHPSLREYRSVTALCRRFDINAWVTDVAERTGDGTVADEEREALYAYILASPETIGRSAVGAIRASPVIKNIAGTWKSPDELALLPSEMRRTLAAVVDSPSEEVLSNEVAVKKLSIRRRLMPRDLVALAKNVGNDVSASQSCEEFLSRHSKLLTSKTVNELRQISFIRTKAGTIAAPEELHLNIAINTMTLDNDEVIVGGRNVGLYKLLKCRAQPSFKALMDMIKRHVRANIAPAQPEVLYSALFVAASLEKRSPITFRDDKVFWVNGAYHSPAETLVGQMVPRFLDVALPVVRYQGLLEKAYADLGASRSPNENHWTTFFHWFDEKAESGSCFTMGELKNLRQAYARRGGTGLPEDVNDDARCLLSRTKVFYSPRDVRDQMLLEDDYPELAKAIDTSESDLAFADLSDDGGQFFAAIGLKRLSEVCGIPHVTMGASAQHPNWYTATFERELLELVHLPDFAIAIQALGWALERQGMGFRSQKLPEIALALRKIEKIIFVSEILKTFDINGVKISVRSAAGLGEDRIGVYPGRSQFVHHLSIAPVLAELVGAVRLVDNRMLAASILPLLSCRTTEDVHGYLRSQGIQVRWSEPELELTEQGSSPPASAVEVSETASKIINDLVGALHASMASPDNSASRAGTPSTSTHIQFASPALQTRQLPPIDEVVVNVAMRAGTQIAPPGSGGWSGGSELARENCTARISGISA